MCAEAYKLVYAVHKFSQGSNSQVSEMIGSHSFSGKVQPCGVRKMLF